MGNTGSHGSGRRRHRSQLPEENLPPPAPQTQTQPQPPPPEAVAERLAAATPYPAQYPNPNQVPYYHYHGYYPQPPAPSLYIHQFRGFPGAVAGSWGGGPPAVPCSGAQAHNPPYVDHQKAVTIRNDVNVKKETLRVEPDEENPGKFLVAFTFDATVSGSLTIMFFAKEDPGFKHIVSKESSLESVVMLFEQGLGQKFRQPCGTGIDFSVFDEAELSQGTDGEVYPLVVKAEAGPAPAPAPAPSSGEEGSSAGNSQITQAVFEKDRGQYRVRVSKQILWVGSKRYELQEIYGIGNSVSSGDYDENESGKECVICLSEPRDTTVLPCRHMCMCSGCAKVLRFQTDRCPICRQPVERLLEIKVNNGPEG